MKDFDEFTPIGPTGLYPSVEQAYQTFKKLKPKFMVKIHINGHPFTVEKTINATEICKLVYVPIDNAELTKEEGDLIPLGSVLELEGGEHFQVYRLRVTGN